VKNPFDHLVGLSPGEYAVGVILEPFFIPFRIIGYFVKAANRVAELWWTR
jgi:hypothetical protein